MSRVAFGWTLLAIVAAAAGAAAQLQTAAEAPAGDTIVIAELFTSEGCSSCPPADRLLEMVLQQQPASGVFVIPLSEHVDYWDHQGWKDPFGSQQFTARQKVYADHFKIDGIYTPQLVIDGADQFVGSDAAELKRVLGKASREPKPLLRVDVAGSGPKAEVAIHGPGLAARVGEATDLMIAVTEDDLVVDVKRGENAKRTLRHSGVVRLLRSLGDPRGSPPPPGAVDAGLPVVNTTLTIKPEWKRDKLRIVAFVQATKTRRVLSVGWGKVG